ncbi:MAG: RNA-directed DNA polymerase [Clostridia bacterium]|nr:RNA-directed DNA polymerase [Clostridia bacterium]
MFKVKNLLRNEYFPTELPPCFNTDDLANFAEEVIRLANTNEQKYSIALKYSGYKSESSRRTFSIPNPYHYCRAVDIIVQNEEDLLNVFRKSLFSLTAPIPQNPTDSQAYSKRSKNIADTKFEIEKLYQNRRYEIRLDISTFFDSIYTHSIPWAIHGKETAKRERSNASLLGNKLDKSIRAMNYDQTNGILVGNAVSRIISEIILCTVDHQIRKKFKDIDCCRFVDDYYIYPNDISQIQEIISFIRVCLSQYELNLNENKIQINESPFLYGKPWIEEVKQYIHLQPEIFLSKLIMEYNKHKDLSIIKYGLRIISQCGYSQKEWPAMQSRLINLWVRFPSLSDRILPTLWQNKDKIGKTVLKKAIYTIIDETILLNREQELVWAIWYAKVFNVTLSKEYIIKTLNSSNELAIIIILDLIYKWGKETVREIKSKLNVLRTYLVGEDTDERGNTNKLLWTSHWLLSYEATKNGWLNIDGHTFDYANHNSFFSELIGKDIKFYDLEFSYEEKRAEGNKFEFATRSELYRALTKLKKALENERSSVRAEELLTEEEKENLYFEFLEALHREERGYVG